MTYTVGGGSEQTYTAETELTAVGEYKFKITTRHKTATEVKAEATYTFSIVEPKNMPSVNADNRYNGIDFSLIRKVVSTTVGDKGALPGADNGFYGGIFSGDMTGDLKLKSGDYDAILNSLRAGEVPGEYYSLPIMNQTKPVSPTPGE